jgi:endonuclease/exonuclease/phosphatase family metal-dependent hydrolase
MPRLRPVRLLEDDVILTCVSWNLLEGGIDAGDDARMRRQMRRIAAERPAVVMLQECNGWDRDGYRLLHLAEGLLGGMRGFLAKSAHGCHLAVFIRESSGLRVVRQRHEERTPYWHGVAVLEVEAHEFGPLHLASAHLAPSSPAIRTGEAEAFKLLAEAGPLVAAGDWNAIPASDPNPELIGKDPEHERRKLDRTAARAIEGAGLTDVAAYLKDLTPTVGHSAADRLAYRPDRFYAGLGVGAITGYKVITDVDDCSDHRPVAATFDLHAAASPEPA